MRIFALLICLCAPSFAPAATFDVDRGGGISFLSSRQFLVPVSGLSGTVQDLDIRVSLATPVIYGTSIELWSPGFTHSVIWDAPLGTGANFQDTYLDDEADGLRLGQPGSDAAPFASPEWGGRRYRPPTDLSTFDGISPNGIWSVIIYQFSGNEDAFLFKNGDSAPWGQAIGTQLIFNTVPEPAGLFTAAFAVLALVKKRKK